MRRNILFIAMLASMLGMMAQSGTYTKPSDFFGFKPGSDRNLFTYEQLIQYLEKLDSESPRLKLEKIGTSPMGKPMYIALAMMMLSGNFNRYVLRIWIDFSCISLFISMTVHSDKKSLTLFSPVGVKSG